MKKFIFAFFLALSLFSCQKKREEPQSAQSAEVPQTQSEDDFQKVSQSVLIVFGHDFNESDFVKKNFDELAKRFGGAAQGGFVAQAVFPDDFTENGRTKLSKIEPLLKNGGHCALISLGAPEGFSVALSNALEDSPEFKAISLFPQDDTLSAESISFAVLSQEMSASQMEQELSIDEDLTAHILAETVAFLRDDFLGKSPKKEWKTQDLHDLMQKIVGENCEILSFFDAKTGIASSNHFLIRQKNIAE